MRTYNSKEPTITIPLAEFQRLSLTNRVLARAINDGCIEDGVVWDIEQQLEKEDMDG